MPQDGRHDVLHWRVSVACLVNVEVSSFRQGTTDFVDGAVDKGVPVQGSLLPVGLLPHPRQRADVFEAQLRAVMRVNL